MSKPICFYHQNDEYGCFSNFSNHPIYLENKKWPTSEHYFQAKKFEGTEHEERIRNLSTPMKAALEGRRRDLPLRKDWEKVKLNIMKTALMAKFTQHDDCIETLMSTKGKTLIEHTKNDSYWGDGGNGTGLNMLGKLLMEIRDHTMKC